MKKQDRIALLGGKDTSHMTKAEIIEVIQVGITKSSARKFILKNKIPFRKPTQEQIHHVTITKECVLTAIESIKENGSKFTYSSLGAIFGFSKQRAQSVCAKFNLVPLVKQLKQKTS